MNRLWVRLSIAFATVVLVAATIILLSAFHINGSRRADISQRFEAPGGLADILAAHYRARNGWADSAAVLAGARSVAPPWAPAGLMFVLRDAQGNAVVEASGDGVVGEGTVRHGTVGDGTVGHGTVGNGTVPGVSGNDADPGHAPDSAYEVLPIRVDGQTVGRLDVMALPRAAPDWLDRLRDQLVLAATVGGVLGVLFGILFSRSITAPLVRLAESALAIGSGDLGRRVEVRGSDELAAVARAFNLMAANLQQAESQRRNLMADVAHELRTPLAVLQANLQAILDDVYPLEKPEIGRLYDQTRLLSRLVDDLHELALAESGQLPLNRQPTDLIALTRATAADFGPVAEGQGLRLVLEAPNNTSSPATALPVIPVDAARIAQVLHNLLANAVRYTPAGGTITLSVDQSPTEAVLRVSDTGQGIAPADLPHVFERFYRTDPARSRERGGTGLGLAIARTLAQAHGGDLALASDGIPGHGTIATVRLPLSGLSFERQIG